MSIGDARSARAPENHPEGSTARPPSVPFESPAIDISAFRCLVRGEGSRLYRDLPWRRTRDPYEIWLSEVMLQQTQVARVVERWESWLERFPSVFALAESGTAEVLSAWQGMGYNRRALALKAAAEEVVRLYDGVFPVGTEELISLPGIGPATAQGIRSFAFDLPGVYLETNVRTVVLHHLFPEIPGVPDRELIPLVKASCPAAPVDARLRAPSTGEAPFAGGPEDVGESGFAVPQDADDTPRTWYYAMLDYGAHLKKLIPNPSRRSKTYSRQSRFEGSRRQKRAELVRQLLDARARGEALSAKALCRALGEIERKAGRPDVGIDLVRSILEDLSAEGFCREMDGRWEIS